MDASFQNAVGFGNLGMRKLFSRECGLHVRRWFRLSVRPELAVSSSTSLLCRLGWHHSDAQNEFPPFALQRLPDEPAVALRTLGLEAHCQCQPLVSLVLLERRRVATQKQIDLTFLGMNAVAAAGLHRRTDLGPRRLGSRGESGERLFRQQGVA